MAVEQDVDGTQPEEPIAECDRCGRSSFIHHPEGWRCSCCWQLLDGGDRP